MTKAAARLEQVAERLVAELVRSVVQASIDELMDLTSGNRSPVRPKNQGGEAELATARQTEKTKKSKNKKEGRRKSSEVEDFVELVVSFVAEKGGKKGLSIGELATGLGTERAKLIRPMQKALESRRVKKKGERRLTRYFPGVG